MTSHIMKHRFYALTCGMVLLALACPGQLLAQTKVGYWLAPRSNQLIDQQVAAELSRRAGVVVLRASRSNPVEEYTFPRIVARLKQQSPGTPVLAYTFVTRQPERGRIEADLLKDVPIGRPVAESDSEEQGLTRFIDVAIPEVRTNIVTRLSGERSRLGVDGYAVDLSNRTPSQRPKILAKVCMREPGYCGRYAEGMDDLFARLRGRLGNNGYLLFNGLWNHSPGVLDDQVQLLSQSDAAAVEYFGMDPNQREHSFSKDILPYLKVMARLPTDKSVLVFGRGPWFYTDYADDYRWQRYLYASFLLAARPSDMFKYHASFQVPAHKGRSGGFDTYADWGLPLGTAQGPSSFADGVYQRRFANGLVLVAPDDGRGGSVRLGQVYETAEGRRIQGNLELSPGEAMILLSRNTQARPVRQVLSAAAIAAWGWSASRLEGSGDRQVLRLDSLPEQLPGEHDVLLDHERSLSPFRQLEIRLQADSPEAGFIAVAEIDDPRREQSWLMVRVGASQRIQGSVDFRSPSKKVDPPNWPARNVDQSLERVTTVLLDGPKIATEAGFVFRRWSHLRLKGPLSLGEVALSAPMPEPVR